MRPRQSPATIGIWSSLSSPWRRIDSSLCCGPSPSAAQEALRPPTFVQKMSNSRALEGDTVRLECKVDASPPPQLYWKKDKDMLRIDPDRMRCCVTPQTPPAVSFEKPGAVESSVEAEDIRNGNFLKMYLFCWWSSGS